mmetsp:Transcript_41671/g.99939  ORF Transcript_41671/g.99939 Transcript_41671/m.99939 type:complete len:664 (-) Transcript_41671:33-2024(-)
MSSSTKVAADAAATARRTESSSTTASTRTETMDNTTGTSHTTRTGDDNEDVEMSMNRYTAAAADRAERNDTITNLAGDGSGGGGSSSSNDDDNNNNDVDENDDNSDNEDDGPTEPLVRHWSFLTADTDGTVISPPMLTRRESFVQSVRAGTNFFGCVANLCSATLGAGILALPFALYQAGLVCGGILLLVSAWATSTSIHLLVQACDKHRLPTYEKIVEKVLGRTARTVVEWSVLIFCCGTAVGYVIAVGDIMERIHYMTAGQRRLAMLTIWSVSMLPLSCLRRMKSLQCASSVGIASIGTLLAAAIVHLVRPAPDKEDYEDLEDMDVMVSMANMTDLLGPAHASWLSVLQACPIFFYAFSCQVNVAQIYEELPGQYGQEKIRKMGWVTWSAVCICGLLYASISIVTLMDFGKHVTPNILSSYDLSGAAPLLHIAFLAMALAVVMAFPLNIFPARVSIIQMWEKNHGGEQLLCGSMDEEAKQPLLCSIENGLNVDENGTEIGGQDGNNNNNNNNEDGEGQSSRPTLDSYDSNGEMPPREALAYDPRRTTLDRRISMITDRGDGTTDREEEEIPEFHAFQHATVTFFLAGLALGLALVVPNISIVFGLLGGTTSSLLGFIVPGLLGLQLDNKCISAWILVIAGSVIGVLTTSVTLYSTFHAINL